MAKRVSITEIKNLHLIKRTLDEVVSHQRAALQELSGTKFTFPKQQKVFHEILIRSYYVLSSVNKLWDDFQKNQFAKFPISILLRTGISDFISLCHLASYRRDENRFSKEYDRLNQNFYKWVTKAMDNISTEEKELQIDFLNQFFPLKFDGDKKPLKVDVLGTDGMIKEIEKGEFAEYSRAYSLFKILSQYEHYSDVTSTMMHRAIKYDLGNFMEAVDLISIGSYLNFQWLGVNQSSIEKMKILVENIGKDYIVD